MVNAMEVHQIRYFQAVAECRSFTRAARREHVSQPTLSHQISKLESELGAKLLHRTGRSVRLTGFGEAFLPEADAILRHIQQARTSIRELLGVAGGRVTLGVIPTIAPFFLPMPLKEFARQHNQIEVRVVEEASGALLQSLREGSIDMAIMPLPVDGKWGLQFGFDSREAICRSKRGSPTASRKARDTETAVWRSVLVFERRALLSRGCPGGFPARPRRAAHHVRKRMFSDHFKYGQSRNRNFCDARNGSGRNLRL
jgi:DNA-binding transcriptional LysR family regulator